MRNRIDAAFKNIRITGAKALIPFITAGDPDLKTTEEMISVLQSAGADLIEIGIPFSDPMADGPTIQLSSERALANGASLSLLLQSISRVRKTTEIPLVLMGYYNPVFKYGLEKFVSDAAKSGVDGVLIVDLPPEESSELNRNCRRHGIHLITLVTPTADEERIRHIASISSGYLYYVSVTGVTGARNQIAVSLKEKLVSIKAITDMPVVVGFGISTPEQAASAARYSDGVVVGSAIVRLFESCSGEHLENEVHSYLSSLKNALQ